MSEMNLSKDNTIIPIIILNGKGGSGKDSIVDGVSEMRSEKLSIHKYSIIDYVKMNARLFGWDGGKELKDRKFLASLLDILMEYNGTPLEVVMGSVASCVDHLLYHPTDKQPIIVVMIRQPHLIQQFINTFFRSYPKLRPHCFIKTILIRRDSTDNAQYGNSGDDSVEQFQYDCWIENNGTLDESIHNFITTVKTYVILHKNDRLMGTLYE